MAPSGIGRMLVFLGCQGCCYFSLVLLLESSVLKRIFYFFLALIARLAREPLGEECGAAQSREDDDVVEEQRRIHETPLSFLTSSQAIVLKDLTKRYGRFVAVNRISTSIGKGECFGLLGINGAGKTSTFQMLTGDASISGGTAYILGHDLKKDFSKVHKCVLNMTKSQHLQNLHCGRCDRNLYLMNLASGLNFVSMYLILFMEE